MAPWVAAGAGQLLGRWSGGQATASPPRMQNQELHRRGITQRSYQGAKKCLMVTKSGGGRLQGQLMQGDLGAEQNKVSLGEGDTQPPAAAQTGPWVLFHPLPIAA